MSMDEYLEIARRRWWIVAIPALVVPALAFAFSLTIPNRYTSQTLVLVEHQKVPDIFVKSVVSDELNQRLVTMQEQILSRTRLQPIIERFGLYKDNGASRSMEDMVEEMRKSITVTPIHEAATPGSLPGFYISFAADKPRLAQQVCAEITSMFMDENLRIRQQSAQGTTDFLKSQLDDAKRKLDEQDAKLADFKRRYIGQLPDDEQTNLGIMANLNNQLAAVMQTLSRAQQEKSYSETLLNQQLAAWQTSQQTLTNPQTLQQQLTNAQAELLNLQARYTPDYPDVIKLQKTIADLKAQIEAASKSEDAQKSVAVKPSSAEPLQIQQLRAQLKPLQQQIEQGEKDERRIQDELKIYQSRIQLSPKIEEDYKAVTRDHQIALGFYNDLLTKMTQSEMSTDLERRQQGEQFQVMDPANLPEKPTSPDRAKITWGALGGGMGLGIALVLLVEMRDRSIRSERDIEFFLALPTFAHIPSLTAEKQKKQKRRLRETPQPARVAGSEA